VKIRLASVCRYIYFNGQGNPIVQFLLGDFPETVVDLSTGEVEPVDTIFFQDEKISTQELILRSDLSDPACSSIAEQNDVKSLKVVFGLYEGEYWIHDPRFVSALVEEHDCLATFFSN
jgi:hypothetical protein